MWRTRVAVPWLAAIAVATTVGCGGDSSGPGGGDVEAGRYTAEITGALEQQISGNAFYFQVDDPGEEGLTIALTNGNGQGLGIVFGRGNPSLPDVAVYQVVNGGDDLPENDFIAISFWGSTDDRTQCFSDDGGELTITGSGANLEGDFRAEVGCLDLDTGEVEPATITGQFNAVEGPADGE
jgi:hypothetical protein